MRIVGGDTQDMTLHFLSRGCAQQFTCLKKAKRYTQAPNDLPGYRPEVRRVWGECIGIGWRGDQTPVKLPETHTLGFQPLLYI